MVFPERNVSDVVLYLDRPVLAQESGEVGGCGLGCGQGGEDVDGFAADPAGAGVLPPVGDLDGLSGVGKVDAEPVDVDGLEGAGLGAAVSGLAGGGPGRDLLPGQGFELGVQ